MVYILAAELQQQQALNGRMELDMIVAFLRYAQLIWGHIMSLMLVMVSRVQMRSG